MKLHAFIEAKVRDDYDEELDDFWGDYVDQREKLGPAWQDLSESVFNLYFMFDMEWNDGQKLIDFFLSISENEDFLSASERAFLKTLRGTSMHLYEVTDLVPGVSVTLRDIVEGYSITVQERSGSRTMRRFEWYAARINPLGASSKPEFECILPISPFVRDEALNAVKEERREFLRVNPGDIEGAYKEMAPLFHDLWVGSILEPTLPQLANTDGEEMLITRIHFDVLDDSGLRRALDKNQDSLTKSDDNSWEWSGKNQRGESVSLGHVHLAESLLVLETNSRERGERGRELLERLAPGLIRHRATTHEDVARELRERIRQGALAEGFAQPGDDRRESMEQPPSALPPEINEALVLDHLSKHYRGWLDENIPAIDGHTPREAAKRPDLRDKLVALIQGLEGMYEQALKDGDPAYDPSWMWDELGIGEAPAQYPPSLAHERIDELAAGAAEVCQTAAEHRRREPEFNEVSTLIAEEGLNASLDFQRFLREYRVDLKDDKDAPDSIVSDPKWLKPHLLNMVNFELHRRKTFWVDEALTYMLAQTDVDVTGRDLRSPFAAFALVFTDRYFLSLAERLLSAERKSPLAGHILKVATVYVTEQPESSGRLFKLAFALDALGADPPALVSREIVLEDDLPVETNIDRLAPPVPVDRPLLIPSPLRGMLQVTLNAILYATSAGVEPEIRHATIGPTTRRHGHAGQKYSSDQVYYLPGAIDISHVRRLQDLERASSGRPMLKRYMVRGHWRRASAKWKDQAMRWIQPYWKGPDIAAVIERAYRLKP